MKIKRYKAAKRNIAFYINNFGFRLPHQILIDGTFTNYALKNQTNIKDQMPKYLGGDCQLLTTACALHEVQAMGKDLYGAYAILKRYKVRHCGHEKSPVSAANCFKSLVGQSNNHHYFIASQDVNLNEDLGKIPGTPVLYMHTNAIILDKPSQASVQRAQQQSASKTSLSPFEQETLEKLKGTNNNRTIEMKKKRRKRKGPNPLSCKKKADKDAGGGEGRGKRKRHKRVKMAEHVLMELMKNKTDVK